MAFKAIAKSSIIPESPESLFLDIKSKKIEGLLTQQGDVLRAYATSYVNSPDVAAQMPTGSGKTLVALLIAEWRRRAKQERVVYLCPTNQLVHQVSTQATQYGINVLTFTGSVREYDSIAKQQYNSAQLIAVTSYSALFNSNPFFSDPGTIVLDDAHVAEHYVAEAWTLDIAGFAGPDTGLFRAIAGVLRPHLGHDSYARLLTQPRSLSEASWVDMVPMQTLARLESDLESTVRENLNPESNLRFQWALLRGHLKACNLFMAPGQIMIRPYLAPTFSHSPFVGATQRLYISATLGDGGELERLFARKRIERISSPMNSERHTIGRRFFVFPELGMQAAEREQLVVTLASEGRLVILTPDNRSSDRVRSTITEKTKARVFDASSIEKSKKLFAHTENAVAILANRYDGIDFQGNECRKLILLGLSTSKNLQEHFFVSRLGASRLYDVRMLTRVVQSIGRCTRSATDFSVVVVLGSKLLSYLAKLDRQVFFHPEIQAELKFGFEQSMRSSLSDTLENIQNFLDQSSDWKTAERELYALRDTSSQQMLPGSEELAACAKDEVAFVEGLWNGNYNEALSACRSLLTKISDPTLKSARAIWNYYAGSIASILSQEGDTSMAALAEEYYRFAAKSAPSLSWLHKVKPVDQSDTDSISLAESLQLEGIERTFERLGVIHDRRYNAVEARIRQNLTGTNFEEGHRELGELLGFDAQKVESQGSPDPWWSLGSEGIWVFEDHADAGSNASISVTKARQVSTHKNWIEREVKPSAGTPIVPVLVTPASRVDTGGACHLNGVYLWPLDEFRAKADTALSCLHDLRSSFSEPGDEDWRKEALRKLRRDKLTARTIFGELTIASNILIEKG